MQKLQKTLYLLSCLSFRFKAIDVRRWEIDI